MVSLKLNSIAIPLVDRVQKRAGQRYVRKKCEFIPFGCYVGFTRWMLANSIEI